MTPTEAAAVIGCSPRHVRALIGAGKIQAIPVPYRHGYTWSITQAEAERYRDAPTSGRGYPRGKKRKHVRR